ncbi:MAG TPA: response regulator transcription factor [Bacillota bacterium]|nr:response regulator transcription factor [Bacillota bacterium]
MIKVVVVDDQVMVREGIRHIIERDPEINVVGCAGSGPEAFDICQELQPDLVLMDIVMPEGDGIGGVKLIKQHYPGIKVIMLTTFNDDTNIVRALNNGADGYMLKDIFPEELIMTVKSAALGLGIVHKNTLGSVAQQIKESSQISILPESTTGFDLGERELAIIRMIVDGKDNKEIANALFISEGSMKNLLSGIFKKLVVKDRVQLAVFAVRNGLV